MHHFPETIAGFRRQMILRHAAPYVFSTGIDLEDFSTLGRVAVIEFLREVLNEIRWLGLHGRQGYDGEAHRALSDALFQEQLALDRVERKEACRECN